MVQTGLYGRKISRDEILGGEETKSEEKVRRRGDIGGLEESV